MKPHLDLKKRDEYFKHGINFIEESADSSSENLSSSNGESPVKNRKKYYLLRPSRNRKDMEDSP